MTVAYDTDYRLSWAPDGRAITFARMTDGTVNLWRQPLEGGPAARLTNYTGGEDIVSHAWSRDGKWLALVRGAAESHVVMLRDVGSGR
jgi:Tol biopolymer transport system component